MRAHLSVVSEHFSERVTGHGGAPIDLAEMSLPASADTPAAQRLVDAIAEAVREMRIRLRTTPAGGDAPLRLGIVATTDAGTGMEIETVGLSLQDVDFTAGAGRTKVLDALHDLERAFLS
ncbi:MAG: hypothetical protein BRD55_08715 [Bacteroidetes bacterium SW_9_63_38]|nr:MAG: hypothetical protein BRD55_08715 [Bacteroidetes bacterium SW_9_63_38]